MKRLAGIIGTAAVLAACEPDPIRSEGEFGRPIPLASGDELELPRIYFVDEGCPGVEAAGGCPGVGEGGCVPLLLDSLAPLTTLQHREGEGELGFDRECIEVRSSAGLAADPPAFEALEDAVTRFRFREVPTVRAPAQADGAWQWLAGAGSRTFEPYGLLGGNLLNDFAVALRTPAAGPPSVTFFGDFPGGEEDLADQGRAFIPLQFPGRLLGRDIGDRCDVGDDDCEIGGFDPQGRSQSAVEATRMVLDACVALPPCAVGYEPNLLDPFSVGTCVRSVGFGQRAACTPANDPDAGGKAASLVLATAVPGMVLFADSAIRMFGPLESLPDCAAVTEADPACLAGQAGSLYLSGWPPAGVGDDPPLLQLRVRSLALVPGLGRSRGPGPCSRAEDRLSALLAQCEAYAAAFEEARNFEDTTPPYAGPPTSDTAVAALGEMAWSAGATGPSPSRWIATLVLPETHPVALSVRRDVAPEAIEPDGLLGTVLFDETVTVLDYTDASPGVRISCLEPQSGRCLVAPSCRVDGDPACCFGLPLSLLSEFILAGDDETCCGALSGTELAEVQALGACRGTLPP